MFIAHRATIFLDRSLQDRLGLLRFTQINVRRAKCVIQIRLDLRLTSKIFLYPLCCSVQNFPQHRSISATSHGWTYSFKHIRKKSGHFLAAACLPLSLCPLVCFIGLRRLGVSAHPALLPFSPPRADRLPGANERADGESRDNVRGGGE